MGTIAISSCALSRSIIFAATGILVHGTPGLQHQHQHRRRKQQHRPPLSVLRRKVPLYVLKLYTELRAAAVSLLVSGILKNRIFVRHRALGTWLAVVSSHASATARGTRTRRPGPPAVVGGACLGWAPPNSCKVAHFSQNTTYYTLSDRGVTGAHGHAVAVVVDES